MAELSARVQTAVVILCTSLYASQHPHDLIRRAGELQCQSLTNQLLGQRPSDAWLRSVTELGARLSEEELPGTAGIDIPPILMPYRT